jgi:endo-1,4-beta-xylanase
MAGVAALLLSALAPTTAGAAVADEGGRIQLGTAVWWACTEPPFAYRGPTALACQDEYTPRYEQILRSGFDVISPENEFKMPWIHPQALSYDFRLADKLAAYAQRYHKRVRGHALIWGRDVASWMTEAPFGPLWTRQTLLAAMRDHIRTVMRHYRDKFPGVVTQWDVVNEAFENTGGRNHNLLEVVIGPDYVEKAFQYAHAADPNALLFYNEYGADQPNRRQQAVLNLVAGFVRRGIPIDGVGMEMHVGTGGNYPSHAELREVMAMYARLGLRVEITEMDVGITPTPAGTDAIADQGRVYRSVFADCVAEPNCTGITVRGIADPYSWRGPLEKPLLYDDSLAAKPFLRNLLAILDRRR